MSGTLIRVSHMRLTSFVRDQSVAPRVCKHFLTYGGINILVKSQDKPSHTHTRIKLNILLLD